MRFRLTLVLAALTAAVAVSQAGAWHAADVKTQAVCLNGSYNITATIVQSGQWPGAYIISVTPSSLPGTTTGISQVSVLIGWPNSQERQLFHRPVTTDGKCAILCPPTVVEKIVYVDRPVERVVEKRVEVPVEKIVYVDRVVEKPVVQVKTVYKVVTKIRWKTRTVVKHVFHTKVIHDRCPPPKVCCEGKG